MFALVDLLCKQKTKAFLTLGLVTFLLAFHHLVLRMDWFEVACWRWWRRWRSKLGASTCKIPLNYSVASSLNDRVHLLRTERLLGHPGLSAPWVWQALELVRSLLVQRLVESVKDSKVINVTCVVRHCTLIDLVVLCLFLGLSHFFEPLFDLVEEVGWKSRLLLGVCHCSDVYFIFGVKCLDLLKDLEGVVLDWLLEGMLQDLPIHNFDHKV